MGLELSQETIEILKSLPAPILYLLGLVVVYMRVIAPSQKQTNKTMNVLLDGAERVAKAAQENNDRYKRFHDTIVEGLKMELATQKAQLEELTQKIDELTKEIKRLNDENDELRKEKEELLQQLKSQRDELQARIEKKDREIERLKAQLENAKSE